MISGGRGERGIFGETAARRIAVLSFAFLLFLPVSQGTVLIIVQAVCAAVALITSLLTKRVLSAHAAAAFALTMLIGLYGLFLGAANPGFWNAGMIFIVTPALFFLYISVLGGRVIKDLVHTCAIMTVAVGAFILAYVGTQTGLLPASIFPSWFLELVGAGYGEKGDASSVRFYGLSTLAAATPMWVASLFVGRDQYLPTLKLRIMAASFGIGGAMVGGRRAIVLGLLLVPLLLWGLGRLVKWRGRTRPRTYPPALVIGGLIGLAAIAPSLPAIIAHPAITNVFDSVSYYFSGTAQTVADDEAIRADQIDGLLDYWSTSPIFGHGLGAVVPGLVRSDRQPWQFETQYPALLMQVGLVGAILLVGLAVTVTQAAIKAVASRPSMRPTLVVTLVGGVAMLIANATNPYLQAPAHHWAIFLPLAVINYMIREPQSPVDMDGGQAPLDCGHAETANAQLSHARRDVAEPNFSWPHKIT
ncbi:hypothetical protein [Arthrobacter sp. Soil761]|uniref:hypothetical protein n=1 Tax=Arthrobacter sp. Soil761 TaxID=1736400 RepID=UPI0006F4AFB4|nr:hypothetical protein [Arthrobacter sp. Soil761]KRE66454.1 hypothetical protein ASG79_10685 [Arthrobacter sp. Soil761]